MRRVAVLLIAGATILGLVAAVGANGARLTEIQQWSTFGAPPEDIGGPIGIDVGPDGKVYVAAEADGGIRVFTGMGVYRRTSETAAATGDAPHDVAVQGDRMYVVSDGGQSLSIFKLPSGRLINSWTSWDQNGDHPSFVNALWGAVDSRGRIYVGDTGVGVIKFSPGGRWLATFGNNVEGVAVAKAARGFEVFTVNHDGQIDVFNQNGTYLWTFGGDFSPDGIKEVEVTADSVYVTDIGMLTLQAFDRDATFRAVVADPDFNFPAGVAADGYGNVYMVDQGTGDVYRYMDGDVVESCRGATPTLLGTLGRDRLVGTAGADMILALDDDDVAKGRGWSDLLLPRQR